MTVVAIDGPAGSGKSTVAAALADRLGIAHVDSGAFYRAATLAVLRAGVDVRDEQACWRVVSAARIGREAGRTLLDGEDVEEAIRGPEVTAAVSAVSGHPAVRAALLDLQRAQVTSAGAVVEGRDAGAVVVPDAAVKVWLTADPRERASRRAAQLGDHERTSLAAHLADLVRRDEKDMRNMIRAPDAVEIDTTGRSVDELVDGIVALVTRAAPVPRTADRAQQADGGPLQR